MTPLEQIFFQNILAMFGGNIMLLGIIGLMMITAFLLMMRLPMIVITPVIIIVGIMFSGIIPELVPIIVIVTGILFAVTLISIFRK